MSAVIVDCHVYLQHAQILEQFDFIATNVAKNLKAYIILTEKNYALIAQKNDQKGQNIMIDKNQKKEEAKKQRNLWPIRPVTQVVKSRKAYNRTRDRKHKKLYDYDLTEIKENKVESD